MILLFTLVQFGLLQFTFCKLGLAPEAGMTLLLAALLGSMVSLLLFRMNATVPATSTTGRGALGCRDVRWLFITVILA